jgi:hypothetical protein
MARSSRENGVMTAKFTRATSNVGRLTTHGSILDYHLVQLLRPVKVQFMQLYIRLTRITCITFANQPETMELTIFIVRKVISDWGCRRCDAGSSNEIVRIELIDCALLLNVLLEFAESLIYSPRVIPA